MKNAFNVFCLLCLFVASVKAGGSWLVDGQAVQSLEVQTTNDDPAALHTDGSRKMTVPLKFDSSASVPNAGIFNAFIPWSGGYSDIFVMDEDEEVMWLASDQNVSFGVGSLFISSGQLTSFDYGSSINFEERSFGGGGWWVYSVLDDDNAIMSRIYADNRYVQQAGITSPLIFDNSLSSPVNGLFKAYVPWDAQYDFFAFNSTHETVVLSPTVDIGFEAGGLVMAGNKLELTGEAAVDFDEHRLGGGWWVDTVLDDPGAVMSRSYADNRYVQKSSGITTNYTVQAGDVLQIQNGVITAINP